MSRGQAMNHFPEAIPHCPPGYRFAFQSVGTSTLEEARYRFMRVCGLSAALKAVFIPGVYRCPNYALGWGEEWPFDPDGGYMCFVPIQKGKR